MLRSNLLSRTYRTSKAPATALAKPHFRSISCRATLKRSDAMPIFPLSVVAFPAATIPLMIFEARYRVLFNTLLAGDPKVEEGLVNPDAPFAGSKRFGMCFIDGQGQMAGIGTILEIEDFAQLEDGRMFITAKGRERFKVLNVVQQKPVLTCDIEYLEEESGDSDEVKDLAKEVADLLRSTIRLNQKMNNISATEDQLEPEELAGLSPRDLSYWMMTFFNDHKSLQQKMLEEDSVKKRLQEEKGVLTDTVNYFAAQSALRSAFSSPSLTTEESPVMESPTEDSSSTPPTAEPTEPKKQGGGSDVDSGKIE